ncbi:MAG: hypothetical protein E3J60_04170 [Dehalococcoidia bacterium]|nr:MAG: hypothetical protein E3J60_04170 [Dehalococcoidia bacterium]
MDHKKLLVLCCHGVYHKGGFYADRPIEKEVYEDHIRLAFSTIRQKAYDVLIISGGYTKPEEEKSEARGYLDWADEIRLDRTDLVILLEEYARSSVENLLFSMCRFYQYFGYFPEEVGACTLHWKKEWFEEVIAPCLCLPNFKVLPVEGEAKKLKEIGARLPNPHEVANKNRADPLEILRGGKVQKRDPWKIRHPYADMKEFKHLFKRLATIEYPWL